MPSSAYDSSKWATLRNGRRVHIRSIRPSDATALIVFHESLDDESKRLRFFTPHPHLTMDEVGRFTTVDHDDREALIALALDKIVAVGRFDRTGEDGAEVAFVVAQQWQNLGLATELLTRLGARATELGIRHFEADTLGENHSMLGVFSHWSPSKKLSFDHGVVHVDMPLEAAAPR